MMPNNTSGNNPIGSLGFEGVASLSQGGGPLSAPSSSGGTSSSDAAYGMTPEQASREFDLLRREATKLERLLEDKVARYQQLAQRLSISGDTYHQTTHHQQQQQQQIQQQRSLLDHVESGLSSSNSTNLNTTNNNSEEEHLSKEISRLLSSFTELLNTRMAPASERTGRSQHALLVKRYREILFDCGSDYYKTMEVVRRKKEARELMRGATTTTTGMGGEGDTNNGMEHLLRERSSIDASLNSTNAILSQASSVRNELRTQGHNLRGVSGTMSVIAGNIPGLNGLIDKIRKKQLQDDRVVGGVVAGCILFTLWYLFG